MVLEVDFSRPLNNQVLNPCNMLLGTEKIGKDHSGLFGYPE